MTFFEELLGNPPNTQVSDRSQPPLVFDLSPGEQAGSGSLHRLALPSHPEQ